MLAGRAGDGLLLEACTDKGGVRTPIAAAEADDETGGGGVGRGLGPGGLGTTAMLEDAPLRPVVGVLRPSDAGRDPDAGLR